MRMAMAKLLYQLARFNHIDLILKKDTGVSHFNLWNHLSTLIKEFGSLRDSNSTQIVSKQLFFLTCYDLRSIGFLTLFRNCNHYSPQHSFNNIKILSIRIRHPSHTSVIAASMHTTPLHLGWICTFPWPVNPINIRHPIWRASFTRTIDGEHRYGFIIEMVI